MREAWERQPGESRQAFEAFTRYRDLSSGRSYARVGRELGKSTGLIERWGSRHRWQERVDTYLRYLDELTVEQQKRAIEEMNERHAAYGKALMETGGEGLERIKDQL